MAQENTRACAWCGSPLSGRQTRFCCDSHKTLFHRAQSPERVERAREHARAYRNSPKGRARRKEYIAEYRSINPVPAEAQRRYYLTYKAKNREEMNRRSAARRRIARVNCSASYERALQRNLARYKSRIATDPCFRAVKNLRRRLTLAVNAASAGKSCGTLALVGCSWRDLVIHLESQFQPGMTWDNYGIHGWHIDHIIPCAGFDLTDPEQQKACFHYTNLQPLWAEENLKKGARLVA